MILNLCHTMAGEEDANTDESNVDKTGNTGLNHVRRLAQEKIRSSQKRKADKGVGSIELGL
jgi:hypothetical protein